VVAGVVSYMLLCWREVLNKNRGTYHKGLPISTFHTLVLSPIENQMRQAYIHTAKPWRQKNPPCQEQEVLKIKEKMSD